MKDIHTTQLMLDRLKAAICIVASPAEEQIKSFPHGCDVPFEIADEYSHPCRWILDNSEIPLTNRQRYLLEHLDELFNEMSGEHNAKLWTESALHSRPEWEEVRDEARKIIDLFNWPPA